MKWLKRAVVIFISRFLPSKGKRLIYITLCYMVWSKNKDPNTIRNELIEINNKLNIIKNTEALNFVIDIQPILLGLTELQETNSLHHDEVPNQIHRTIPTWLRYDSIDKIHQDMKQVFKERYCHSI